MHAAQPPPGLFLDLAGEGADQRFTRFDVPADDVPEVRKQPSVRAAFLGEGRTVLIQDHRADGPYLSVGGHGYLDSRVYGDVLSSS